jgi:hypothetical protein
MKKKGFWVEEKTRKKKVLHQVFVRSLELRVDPVGRLVYSGPTADPYFE